MTIRPTLSLAGLLLATAIAAPLHAQQRGGPPQGGPPPQGPPPGAGPQRDDRRGPPFIDDRIQRMTADLGLSADQAAKVRTVLTAEQRSADSVLARRVTEMDAERAAMQAMHTRTEQSIQGILTPEQRTKHLANRARMAEQGGRGPGGPEGMRGGRGRGPAGGPPDDRRGPPPGGAPDAPDDR